MKPAGKNIAIIAYITFIGMLIAYFMNQEHKHSFATWHIKNMFGLFLILISAQVSHAYISNTLGDVLWLVGFVAWLLSLIMCLSNKKKAIPVLSDKFQDWFTFLN